MKVKLDSNKHSIPLLSKKIVNDNQTTIFENLNARKNLLKHGFAHLTGVKARIARTYACGDLSGGRMVTSLYRSSWLLDQEILFPIRWNNSHCSSFEKVLS